MSSGAIGCVIVLVLALDAFFYWVAWHIATYFGVNGWVGLGIAFCLSILAAAARSSSK